MIKAWRILRYAMAGFGRPTHIVIALALLVVGLPNSMGQEEPKQLSLKLRVSAFLMTEDSKHLATTHRSDGVLVIIDPATMKETKRLKVTNPGQLMSRSGLLYVPDTVTGLIKVFSESTWTLVNEIDSGVKPLKKLSAPSGKHFKKRLLASSDTAVHLVDAERDQFIKIRSEGTNARYNWDGTLVIEKKGGQWRSFRAADYYKKEETPIAAVNGNMNDPIPLSNGFWLGPDSLYVGTPPQAFMGDLGQLVVREPETQGKVVYVVKKDATLEVRQLDADFTLLETVTFPKKSGRSFGGQPCWARSSGDGLVTLFWVEDSKRISSWSFHYSPPLYAGSKEPYRLNLPKADKYELAVGPPGAQADLRTNQIIWIPKEELKPGTIAFKVKCTAGGQVSFYRKTLTVLPAKEEVADRFLLHGQGPLDAFAWSVKEDRAVVLDHDRLIALGKTGRVRTRLALKKNYRDVACVGSGYALVRKEGVDLISAQGKQTGSTIGLDNAEGLGLAAGVGSNSLYVTSKDATEKEFLKGFPIYQVDLASRSASRLPRVFGMHAVVHPAGDQLVSFISHSQIHVLGFVEYFQERADVVMSHQVGNGQVTLDKAFTDHVEGIRSISYSGDGSDLAILGNRVLSRGRMVGGQASIYSSNSIEKPQRLLPIQGGQMQHVQFHPQLDLTFVISTASNRKQTEIAVFDKQGSPRNGMLKGAALPHYGDHVIIAPDGRSIFVRGRDVYGRRILQRFPLALSAKDKQQLLKGWPSPVPVYDSTLAKVRPGGLTTPQPKASSALARGLSKGQIKQLLLDPAEIKKQTPSEISYRRMRSVVIVNGGASGVGAGFFVSDHGHILTAAHCLPSLGGPEIYHYLDLPFEKVEFTSSATVIDVDEARDLALLKIDCNAFTPPAEISTARPDAGQAAYAIGHPGTEALSLDYTITSGLVSGTTREIDGLPHFQISAPVNPGNSGGPVLDDRGLVIGLVSQKARLEGASFAVPAASLREFLERSHTASEPPKLEQKEALAKIRSEGWTLVSKVQFTGAKAKEGGKPFNGTLAVLGNPQNHVFLTLQYKNGNPHGNLVQYARDGQRVRGAQFKEGAKEGLVATWYPSGNLKTTSIIRDGKPNGFVREYADKKHGVSVGVSVKGGLRHGPSYRMDELGRLIERVTYIEGKAVQQTTVRIPGFQEGVPIIEFSKAGDLEIVQTLVEEGTSVDTLTKSGICPLHAAIDNDQFHVVRGLLELGANINIEDKDRKTALHKALHQSKPDLDLARFLISKGAAKDGIPKDKLDLLK